ncbi:hypothetical protein DFH06DRAFT_1433226 [Mycena polygramma]|nr:hypothetical protein DFH06DRAFT_1433226 [Mycena polygramma]
MACIPRLVPQWMVCEPVAALPGSSTLSECHTTHPRISWQDQTVPLPASLALAAVAESRACRVQSCMVVPPMQCTPPVRFATPTVPTSRVCNPGTRRTDDVSVLPSLTANKRQKQHPPSSTATGSCSHSAFAADAGPGYSLEATPEWKESPSKSRTLRPNDGSVSLLRPYTARVPFVGRGCRGAQGLPPVSTRGHARNRSLLLPDAPSPNSGRVSTLGMLLGCNTKRMLGTARHLCMPGLPLHLPLPGSASPASLSLRPQSATSTIPSHHFQEHGLHSFDTVQHLNSAFQPTTRADPRVRCLRLVLQVNPSKRAAKFLRKHCHIYRRSCTCQVSGFPSRFSYYHHDTGWTLPCHPTFARAPPWSAAHFQAGPPGASRLTHQIQAGQTRAASAMLAYPPHAARTLRHEDGVLRPFGLLDPAQPFTCITHTHCPLLPHATSPHAAGGSLHAPRTRTTYGSPRAPLPTRGIVPTVIPEPHRRILSSFTFLFHVAVLVNHTSSTRRN